MSTWRPPIIGTCSIEGCEAQLRYNVKRKGTVCHYHARQEVASRPERNAKIARTVKAQLADPNVLSARSRRISEARTKQLRENPELMRQAQEQMRAVGKANGGSANWSAETRAAARRKQRARKLADIPMEYRDEYTALCRRHNLSAPEARRIIRDQVDRDLARYIETGKLQQTTGG